MECTRIVSFEGSEAEDVGQVGGKGANLAVLSRAGLPVPPDSWSRRRPIWRRWTWVGCARHSWLRSRRSTRPTPTPSRMRPRRWGFRGQGRRAAWLRDELLAAYHGLGRDVPVAVRSSATAEDAAGTSFAGMHETVTNVVGDVALVAAVVACWRSLYTERALAYRRARSLDEEPVLAVVVQKMVPSERSGSSLPSTPQREIGATWSSRAPWPGEVVVGGESSRTPTWSARNPSSCSAFGWAPRSQSGERSGGAMSSSSWTPRTLDVASSPTTRCSTSLASGSKSSRVTAAPRTLSGLYRPMASSSWSSPGPSRR